MYLKISNRYFVSNQKITVSLDLDHLKEPDSISFFLTSNSNIYILESLLCSACHSSSRFNASRINIPHTGTLFHSCFFAIQVGFLLTCSYYKHSLYCFFFSERYFPNLDCVSIYCDTAELRFVPWSDFHQTSTTQIPEDIKIL